MTPAERVRQRIQTALDRDGWSQREFAGKVEKTQPWLQQILAGKNRVRLDDLDLIAQVLKVPPAELIREVEDPLVEVRPSEMQLLSALRSLGMDDQHRIIEIVKAMVSGRTDADLLAQPKGSKVRKAPPPKVAHDGSRMVPIGSEEFRQKLYDLSLQLAALATGATERPALETPRGEKP